MSWYITELALYNKEFISVRPSVMARSSLALARCILNRPQPRFSDWSAQYDPQVVLNLSNHLGQPSQALLRKYAAPHLSSVSTTIEMFLARQAALATRVVQTPTIEIPTMDIHQQAPAGAYLTPQTPQKPGFHAVPPGILTPPITPDKDFCNQHVYGTNPSLVPQIPGRCTPTPPSSVEHQQQCHFVPQHYDHYMQQPQLVQ